MERRWFPQNLNSFVFILVCAGMFSASAQDIRSRMLGIWPGGIRGKANTIFLGDRYAFVAAQANYGYSPESVGTIIFDISNPERPRRVGALAGYWSPAI